MSTLASNLEVIQSRIARATEDSGRKSDDVTLIAVTKTVPVGRIKEAYAAGLRNFGENRVQEALVKFAPQIGDPDSNRLDSAERVERDGVTLHMIGGLQRNKAQAAVGFFDMVHSVDRLELIDALETGVERVQTGRNKTNDLALPVLIEVNITGETSKSGAAERDVQTLAAKLSACSNLRGLGLMTIARQGVTEAESRRTFAQLRLLLEDLQSAFSHEWRHLSMGMSDDYEAAIREGATMVRLGRALFGDRSG